MLPCQKIVNGRREDPNFTSHGGKHKVKEIIRN